MIPQLNPPAAFDSVGVSSGRNDVKDDVVGALDRHIALGRSGLRVSPLCLVRLQWSTHFERF